MRCTVAPGRSYASSSACLSIWCPIIAPVAPPTTAPIIAPRTVEPVACAIHDARDRSTASSASNRVEASRRADENESDARCVACSKADRRAVSAVNAVCASERRRTRKRWPESQVRRPLQQNEGGAPQDLLPIDSLLNYSILGVVVCRAGTRDC